MHKEILSKEQIDLLPLVRSFSKDFGLVGGTAIALYFGHRQSIDFDLFTGKEFDNLKLRKKIFGFRKVDTVIRDENGQYTIVIHGVRFTFFCYPFKINFSKDFDGIIKLPDLFTLAAMKAYALGRRAKWKDYVDMYFIAKKYGGIAKIISKAKQIFGSEFNEKLFRSQLAYFQDIDHSEKVIFMKDMKVGDVIIKKGLKEFSVL